VKLWSVASGPRGLSVNKAHNVVVVCCYRVNKIQEYTTHGTLVREIPPQSVVTNPWHAVQLSTGDYVVIQNTSQGVVSIVRVGEVVRSYHPLRTSDVGELGCLGSLAVTKNDDILVGDCENDRILAMNSSLSSAQQLALPVDDGILSVWTSHEVDFTSVNLVEVTEYWSLTVLDDDIEPSA